MPRRITQRELRNAKRALDKGRAFVVTHNVVPVGELIPLRQREFVAVDAVRAAFAAAPRIARARFRMDVNAALNQIATPRG